MRAQPPRSVIAIAALSILSAVAAASSCARDEYVLAVELDAGPMDAEPVDASEPEVDSAPPPLPTLGPSVVLDDMHIASIQEEAHAFSLLGMALNEQLTSAIADGTLLLGLEVRQLDDPAGQEDPMITVGMYGLNDADGDPSDNFDPDKPEEFTTTALFTGNGGSPTIHFESASISGGQLHAEGVGLLSIPGLPIPFQRPTIDGALVASEKGDAIRTLENGRLKGAVAVSLLANAPNISMGQCKGSSLLDVIATGCGFITIQPDVDLDDDGFEKLFDDEGGDPDAGSTKDGVIDRCVDGDGTEILGTDCVSDPRIKDGYRLIFVIHGVRAIILEP